RRPHFVSRLGTERIHYRSIAQRRRRRVFSLTTIRDRGAFSIFTGKPMETRGLESGIGTYTQFVDGQWSEAAGGDRFESINPYSGEVCATFPESGSSDVDAAIVSARDAFDRGPWGRMNGYERGRLMLRLADALEKNTDLIARTESINNGKLIRE